MPKKKASKMRTNKDGSKSRRGLWANVHDKRARGEKPAKPGDKSYPTDKAIKRSSRKKK
jgi:hypothetical protein